MERFQGWTRCRKLCLTITPQHHIDPPFPFHPPPPLPLANRIDRMYSRSTWTRSTTRRLLTSPRKVTLLERMPPLLLPLLVCTGHRTATGGSSLKVLLFGQRRASSPTINDQPPSHRASRLIVEVKPRVTVTTTTTTAALTLLVITAMVTSLPGVTDTSLPGATCRL